MASATSYPAKPIERGPTFLDPIQCDHLPSTLLTQTTPLADFASGTHKPSGEIESDPSNHAEWSPPRLHEGLARDFPEKLARELDRQLGVAIWLTRPKCRLKDKATWSSDFAKKFMLSDEEIKSLAEDVRGGEDSLVARCAPEIPHSPSIIMEQVWAKRPSASAIAVPLRFTSSSDCWTLTAAWFDDETHSTALRLAAWTNLNSASIGQALSAWQLYQRASQIELRYETWKKFLLRPSRWIALAVLLVSAAMFVPVPYRPTRECVIEPSTKNFVASPIEGRLKSVLVRPGDEVKKGQLLATLDDSQILRDLYAAEADLESHSKKRDIALASRAGGDLRIAQLQCQQIQFKIDSLKDQLQRLTIASPTDGVLVQGDWFGNEGMPVTFGQSLFEISPLDRMIAEVRFEAEDLPWVAVGTKATMRSETSLTQSWQGQIARLEPRAEVVDDKAVFIGEMEIGNETQMFRPGMKASVVVNAGSKTLGWILFRKPYQWLHNQMIW